jgi:thiol-disulfide isomerase/thioredoxin
MLGFSVLVLFPCHQSSRGATAFYLQFFGRHPDMVMKKLRIPNTFLISCRHDSRLLSVVKMVLITCLGIVWISFSSAIPSWAMEKSLVPSYGEGKYELIVFTDYFCPPCQMLEVDAETSLKGLLAAGGVKVTFIDVPIHKYTPLYVKYFLYTANAGANYKDILNVRKILFTLAKANTITTEEGLANALHKERIVFKPYDLKKVYAALDETIRKYNIRSTPTCVVRYSDSDVRKYVGGDEIKQGLSLLQSRQKKASR